MINQLIVERKVWYEDARCIGFHVYEDYTKFINRVTEQANDLNGDIINIVYPNENTAVIVWRQDYE